MATIPCSSGNDRESEKDRHLSDVRLPYWSGIPFKRQRMVTWTRVRRRDDRVSLKNRKELNIHAKRQKSNTDTDFERNK
jgi:hypothetical protein